MAHPKTILQMRLAVRGPSKGSKAFTAIDLLVSMFVITILIALLLPTLGTVQEAARRTACLSNVRQIGFGLSSFADERRGLLPPSAYKPDYPFGSRPSLSSAEMMRVRIGVEEAAGMGVASVWDGLGLLHSGGFLLGPKVYYCPSHQGDHRFREYAQVWGDEDRSEVICNYQFRGSDRTGNRRLFQMEPLKTALVSDGLRSLSDYNHMIGCNLLRADLSVEWLPDRQYRIASLLKAGTNDRALVDEDHLNEAWLRMDTPGQAE